MSYRRVIPRDFFNEAKLLKCLGALQLAIGDKRVNGLPLVVEFDGDAFDIRQNPDDASLSCSNYRLYLGHEEIELFSPYNSKEAYPLIGRFRGEEYYIFAESGDFMPNFGCAPILSGEGFSEFWKTCPSLPWFKAMQKFHAEKSKEQK